MSNEPPAASLQRRARLTRLLRVCGILLSLGVIVVLLDFLIDLKPPGIQESYRFRLPDLAYDEPVVLYRDNLGILVIRRSTRLLEALSRNVAELQDPESRRSRQPADVDPRHRARRAEYFVAYAVGTDYGCPLRIEADHLRETCGPARYDFAGRAYRGDTEFSNLSVPDYNFSADFKTLTVFP